MFTTLSLTPAKIVEEARKDLSEFIDSVPRNERLVTYFHLAKDEAKRWYKRLAEITRLSKFLRRHLDWLEGKYPVDYRTTNYKYQRRFLLILEGWLRRFTMSKESTLPRIVRAPKIQEFGRFIAKHKLNKSYSFHCMSKQEGGYDLRGFPTFLFLAPGLSHASIAYDKEKIEAKTNPHACERRYELCFLHEIGHMRLHYDWILDTQEKKKEKQVCVMPQHETHAWLYAYAVMGCLAGLRSRIIRLVNRIDEEGVEVH